jgi:hypothetical protein
METGMFAVETISLQRKLIFPAKKADELNLEDKMTVTQLRNESLVSASSYFSILVIYCYRFLKR